MKIPYTKKESFPATYPPVEPGTYAVKRKGGKTQYATWDGVAWIGLTDVVRYSGLPALLSDDARRQKEMNIRAGLEVPEGLEQRAVAQKCAMELARHMAVRAVRQTLVNSSDVLPYVRRMVGYFTVARTLGVSFASNGVEASTLTDRKLFAWGIKQIRKQEPEWLARAASRLENTNSLRAWLNNQ